MPASILQLHPDLTVVADEEALGDYQRKRTFISTEHERTAERGKEEL